MDPGTLIALATALGIGAIVDRVVARLFGRKAAQVELAAAAVQVANEVLSQVRLELEKCEKRLIETQMALESAHQEINALRTELAAYRRETGSEDLFDYR